MSGPCLINLIGTLDLQRPRFATTIERLHLPQFGHWAPDLVFGNLLRQRKKKHCYQCVCGTAIQRLEL
jgi:hypothetical protein